MTNALAEASEHIADMLTLTVMPLGHDYPSEVSLTVNATVHDLIVQRSLEGCDGFLAIPPKRRDGCCYDDDDHDVDASTGLAEKMAADGGILMQPEHTIASHGLVDAATCAEIWLVPVFGDTSKQPTVFKKDLDDLGFGETILKYVKLNTEDKEIVAARGYFSGTLFPWLNPSRKDPQVSVAFSMVDEFAGTPKRILTVHIAKRDGKLEISCTNMAGEVLCLVELQCDDSVAKLESALCEKLKWAGAAFWHESEQVSASDQISCYSLLTAHTRVDHICGCYQYHGTGHHPAGYSASGTTSSHVICLEPGKAGLRHYFKGDYKRADELLQMVMTDASWTIEFGDDGNQSVAISGKATLNRFWVHERSGHSGMSLSNYECFALVKIPLEYLEALQQSEEYNHTSSPGSGWTCGSEDYRCNFFLPMCLVEALREEVSDALELRSILNRKGSQDYPYNDMGVNGHYFRRFDSMLKLSRGQFEMIKHFRTNLVAASRLSVADLIKLQDAAPEAARQDTIRSEY
jgi:hypothetical protein